MGYTNTNLKKNVKRNTLVHFVSLKSFFFFLVQACMEKVEYFVSVNRNTKVKELFEFDFFFSKFTHVRVFCSL